MELFYASLVSLAVVSFSFFVCCILLFRNKSFSSASCDGPLPPGQMGWPVIGESIAFLRSERKGHPEKFIFDRINKYSSYMFSTNLLGQKTVVFCGPTANKFLFSNENKVLQTWWPTSINKLFPPSEHTNVYLVGLKLKQILHKILGTEALQGYIHDMDELAQRHFETCWRNETQVVVYPLTMKFTFSIACKLFLSIEDPKQLEKLAEPFNVLASGIFSIPINFPGSKFNRAMKASVLIRKMITDMIKKRKIDLAAGKATSTQDIMSHMLLLKDENGEFIEEIDITNKIIALLVGGHDTLSSACTMIVNYLADLPHIYEEVYKEQTEIAKSKAPREYLNWDDIQKMKYSWNVVSEVLRIAPPIQGTFREAIVDFMFNGFSIPKGWKIYWSVNSTHKNPEFFPEPQKFDPFRFQGTGPAPYTYVAFGGGPRMCPGKEYARLEILVFMYNLVKRFKWEKVIQEENIVIDPIPIPAKGLPIRLYPLDAYDF